MTEEAHITNKPTNKFMSLGTNPWSWSKRVRLSSLQKHQLKDQEELDVLHDTNSTDETKNWLKYANSTSLTFLNMSQHRSTRRDGPAYLGHTTFPCLCNVLYTRRSLSVKISPSCTWCHHVIRMRTNQKRASDHVGGSRPIGGVGL